MTKTQALEAQEEYAATHDLKKIPPVMHGFSWVVGIENGWYILARRYPGFGLWEDVYSFSRIHKGWLRGLDVAVEESCQQII